MENIGVGKVDGDVAIGMSRPVILQGDTRSIELQSPLVVENVRGNCSSRSGRKSKVPAFHSCRCGKALFRIRVSEDRGTRRVQPLIAVGVVEVLVSIDELLNGIGADRSERICKLQTRAGEACVN